MRRIRWSLVLAWSSIVGIVLSFTAAALLGQPPQHGTGYDPFPRSPNPAAIAASKGLVASEAAWTGQGAATPPGTSCPTATTTCLPPPQQTGDPDVYAATIARWGAGLWVTARCGAEHELEFRGALEYWCGKGLWGTGYDCRAYPRELRDATVACEYQGLVCAMFRDRGDLGYSADNPVHVSQPTRAPGPFTAKAGSCMAYFWNDYTPPAVTPTPQPSATPVPTPEPTPAPCPRLRPAPPGCGLLDVLVRKLVPSLLTWGRVRADNAAACKAWRDETNAVLQVSTGRICVEVVP